MLFLLRYADADDAVSSGVVMPLLRCRQFRRRRHVVASRR
jgi:hypothetical protein